MHLLQNVTLWWEWFVYIFLLVPWQKTAYSLRNSGLKDPLPSLISFPMLCFLDYINTASNLHFSSSENELRFPSLVACKQYILTQTNHLHPPYTLVGWRSSSLFFLSSRKRCQLCPHWQWDEFIVAANSAGMLGIFTLWNAHLGYLSFFLRQLEVQCQYVTLRGSAEVPVRTETGKNGLPKKSHVWLFSLLVLLFLAPKWSQKQRLAVPVHFFTAGVLHIWGRRPSLAVWMGLCSSPCCAERLGTVCVEAALQKPQRKTSHQQHLWRWKQTLH